MDLPPSLFLVRIRKEEDLLALREDQTEGPLDTIESIIFVCISGCPRLIVFNRNSLFEVNGSRRLFGHVIKSDEIRTNYS